MKEFLIKFFILIVINFNNIFSLNVKWNLPVDRYYHEVTFLTAHNAFSSEEDGYVQPQQKYSLEHLLEFGVRGFMLDVHYAGIFSGKKKIRLCHGNCTLTRLFLRPFKGKPLSFKKALIIFKNFLYKNKNEIITLFLENYTESHDLDSAIESAKIDNIILKPDLWDPDKNDGWPKISWMQSNNKRLVIFNPKGQTKYAYDEWSNHYENQYGTTNVYKAANERLESRNSGKNKERYIFVLNYFPSFYIKSVQRINFDKINSNGFARLINYMLSSDKVLKNRYPNFIAADYVHEGNLLSLVNNINNKANDYKIRKIMYSKIKKSI